jgi:regulator of protease activity HflC (stomatin/prohibitin superfamily)
VAKTAGGWGLSCFRYEILSIEPPDEIKISMQYEAEAERNKRRDILISEGKKQADINISEGAKVII